MKAAFAAAADGTEIAQSFYQQFYISVLRYVFAVLTDTLHKVSHCAYLIHSGERAESVSLQWSAVQAHIRLSAARVLVVVLACLTACLPAGRSKKKQASNELCFPVRMLTRYSLQHSMIR